MSVCLPLSGLIRDKLMLCEVYFIGIVSLFDHKTMETQLFMFSSIFFVCRKCEKLQWSFKHHIGEWIWEQPFQKYANQPHCQWLKIILLQLFFSNTVTSHVKSHFHSPKLLLHLNMWDSNTFSVLHLFCMRTVIAYARGSVTSFHWQCFQCFLCLVLLF